MPARAERFDDAVIADFIARFEENLLFGNHVGDLPDSGFFQKIVLERFEQNLDIAAQKLVAAARLC